MEFKRINFFKGFFTQAEDWQAAQAYHIEKRKLHNKCLHTPGIVYGHLESLEVVADPDGTSLYIGPGNAVDGEGRDLYLSRPVNIPIVPQDYKLPTTVYVVIRYNEEEIDRRENVANPEYSDYAFIRESPRVELTTDAPDNLEAIELARIEFSKKGTRVTPPPDPENPGPNEIDRRHVQKAGGVRGRTSLKDFGQVVREGEVGVASSKEPIPSEKDTNVLIERIEEWKDAHRFYLASVYPDEEARIIWRIESSFSKDAVEYRLFFENFSKRAVKVYYRVYRLD